MATQIVNVVGVAATGFITVEDYASFTNGDTITVGSLVLTVGGNLNVSGASNNADAATTIAAALNSLSSQVTAVANSTEVDITAAATGAAGNSIVLQLVVNTLPASVSGPALTGGVTGVSGLIASTPIRLKTVAVKSSGSALGVHVRNGTTTAATEYDMVTGVSDQTVIRNYKKCLVLPAGCYLSLDADVIQVTAQFERI